jgi:hypothetical protein
MFTASNIRYEISDRDRGIAHSDTRAVHALARRTGLNIAYNALCEATLSKTSSRVAERECVARPGHRETFRRWPALGRKNRMRSTR